MEADYFSVQPALSLYHFLNIIKRQTICRHGDVLGRGSDPRAPPEKCFVGGAKTASKVCGALATR